MESSNAIFATLSESLINSAAYVLLFSLIFLVAKWSKDWFTPYRINEELTEKDNLAVAITMAGYYFGVTAIFTALLKGQSQGLQADLLSVASFSLAGIAVLNLSRWLNDKLVLRAYCSIERLTQDHDLGAAAVQFAAYAATGMIAAGAVSGEGSLLSFLVFFLLGQTALIAFSWIYDLFTPFDVQTELAQQNLAASIAFAGTLMALGIIMSSSVSGDFSNWYQDIIAFAISVVVACGFLPILLIVADRLVIPGKSLRNEIQHDKNLGAGVLEATIAIAYAVVLVTIL